MELIDIYPRLQILATPFLTPIQGLLSASAAVILLLGSGVSICLIRLFTSLVTVSHSGDGNWNQTNGKQVK